MKLSAEQIDVCQNLKDSVDRAFRSKRMLRILSKLYEDGLIDLDVLANRAELTDAGRAALAEQKDRTNG